MSAVDLDVYVPQDTYTLAITKPGTNTPIGWSVVLAGPAHPKTVAWSESFGRRSLEQAARIEQAQANGRKYKAEIEDIDEARKRTGRWVASRIVDWTPVNVDGIEYSFSDDNVVELFLKPKLGVFFKQITDYLESETAFIKDSAKN